MQSFASCGKIITTLLTVSFFLIQCSPKAGDEYCDQGFGQTTLNAHVLDFYTNEPIDSIEISIVYGASWDHFLDTLVKQDDSLSFTFNTPNDCESYFVTLSNKYYWTDIENHPAYKVGIEKGAANKFRISFKPATVFKVIVGRNTLDNIPDSVLLQIKKENNKDWESVSEISEDDFSIIPTSDLPTRYTFLDSGTHRMISTYYDMESNVNYDVRWILSDNKNRDTLISHFTAKPFDTVSLRYKFKKIK